MRAVAALILSLLATGSSRAQSASSEEAAFVQARATAVPRVRVEALQQFLRTYPHGAHVRAAQQDLLTVLLENFPSGTEQLHDAGQAILNSSDPGFDRWTEQCRLADTFASTGDHGVDLPDADVWARSSLANFSEPAYARSSATMARTNHLPRLKAAELHLQFTHDRAACVLALANVQLHQERISDAEALLAEAARLQPMAPELALLRGELAFAKGQQTDALNLLLRADAMAPLPPVWRAHEVDLYTRVEHGDTESMEQRIDSLYHSLYPGTYTLAPRTLAPGGHPALLELFTGSDCLPCAAPDLALDSLLSTYGRQDLIALEYDEPIPSPDPLATPGGLQRAAFYGIESTPTALLDGLPLPVLGATRKDVENVVLGFADQVEATAGLRSGISLQLAATRAPDNVVNAVVQLSTHPLGNTPPDETTGNTSLRAMEGAVLTVALVQNNLRYNGRNGVRLHRMVVRALEQMPATEALGGRAVTVHFDPSALEASLADYLQHYETENDRFGRFHFRQTRFPLPPDQATVVAWVQDSRTHQVLNSAFAAPPLP